MATYSEYQECPRCKSAECIYELDCRFFNESRLCTQCGYGEINDKPYKSSGILVIYNKKGFGVARTFTSAAKKEATAFFRKEITKKSIDPNASYLHVWDSKRRKIVNIKGRNIDGKKK